MSTSMCMDCENCMRPAFGGEVCSFCGEDLGLAKEVGKTNTCELLEEEEIAAPMCIDCGNCGRPAFGDEEMCAWCGEDFLARDATIAIALAAFCQDMDVDLEATSPCVDCENCRRPAFFGDDMCVFCGEDLVELSGDSAAKIARATAVELGKRRRDGCDRTDSDISSISSMRAESSDDSDENMEIASCTNARAKLGKSRCKRFESADSDISNISVDSTASTAVEVEVECRRRRTGATKSTKSMDQ